MRARRWLCCQPMAVCVQRNRVVAAGLRFPLELFKAEGGKGWGVRCAVDLQPGSVLCTYIGEILTDKWVLALSLCWRE